MKNTLLIAIILFLSFGFAQDYSGQYQEQSGDTVMTIVAVANGYEGSLVQGDTNVKLTAQIADGMLQGLLLMKDLGYTKNVYFEAVLAGDQLNLTTAPIDDSGNIDKANINQYLMLRSSANNSPSPTIGGKLPSGPVANNPLGGSSPSNPLGGNNPNSNNPISASSSNYSGIYIEDGSTTRLELYKTANGYEGLLEDGDLKVKLQAEEKEDRLIGIFLFKDAGYERNLYFEGIVSGNTIDIQFAPIDEQGNVDQASIENFTLIKQSGQTVATQQQTQIGSSNPLASSGSGSQDFVGSFEKEGARFIVEATANGYQGAMILQGNQFPFVAQLNGSSLVGKFSANGQEIPFEARLEGNTIILNISGDSYQLSRVSNTQANTSAGKIPSNPLTNRGNNSSPVSSQNPINSLPTSNTTTANTANAVQAGQTYPAGSMINSPWTGTSFTVPSAYTSIYDTETGLFLIVAENQQSVFLLQAASQATATSLARFALEFIKQEAEGEIQFLGQPQETANFVSASISADDIVMHIASKSATSGNAIVVMAVGVDAQALASFVASINFSEPQAQNIALPLGGLALVKEANDAFSEGGLYNNTQDYEGYLFCSDSRYAYEYSSKQDIMMGDFSDTFTESDAHQGSWHASASFMGETVLMLESNEGRSFIYTIAETANGVSLNRNIYSVSQNGQCN